MKLTPGDLAKVHAAAFTQTRAWSAQEFTELLQSPGVILCGDVRSFLLGRVIADEAEVLTVATDPDFRRQGLARKCLQQFLTNAAKTAAQTAFLEVSDDNEPAKSLYRNEGFQTVGQRPNYYQTADGRKVAAVVMHRALK